MSTGPSFRFRLERVRALRERREDLARQELAQALVRCNGGEDRLRSVDANLQRVLADQRRATSTTSTVGVEELRARQAFVEHVEVQRSNGARELQRLQDDVAARDSELGLAAREHRMLERLKERQRDEHAREAGRREATVLDEIALDRFRQNAA